MRRCRTYSIGATPARKALREGGAGEVRFLGERGHGERLAGVRLGNLPWDCEKDEEGVAGDRLRRGRQLAAAV
jgi:hypothetical protein